MRKVTAVLIGAGQRGMDAYGPYALANPHEIQFTAVAEPDVERRDKFRLLHGISEDRCFSSWKELLERPRMADAILICTQDSMHFEPGIKALEKGYHVLLEKPMATDPNECISIGEYALKFDRVFSICHVLRYTSFFSTLKKLVDQGRIGRLISIQHNENVGYWHQAHSFVRGNWRKPEESSPMILAKCCHDMDIMLWFAGTDCKKISSFGSLTHFIRENAPEGAPERCLDGCPVERECPYDVLKYLNEHSDPWASIISNDTSLESRLKALKDGPYGRCVYHCDNTAVDHQVVSIKFANEVTAAFTMCAFTNECCRTIKLMGTKGEIRGVMEKNEIEILDFSTGTRDIIYIRESEYGHGGGDYGIMHDFVRLVQKDGADKGITSAWVSVQSHLMAFAAEKARLENKVIDMNEYIKELTSLLL